MDIEQAIVAKLLADATLAALVGTRVYPGLAPQGAAAPYLVYQQADRQKVHTLGGVVSLNNYRMRFDAFGSSYANAKATAAALASALDGFSGLVGSGAIKVQGAFLESEEDDLDEPVHGGETGVYSVGADVSIWFNPV